MYQRTRSRNHETTKPRNQTIFRFSRFRVFVTSCFRVFVCFLVMLVAVCNAFAQDSDISVTPIARDGQVLVSFDLSDAFTDDVRDAIQSGLSTTFSYEVELRRGAAFFEPSDPSGTRYGTEGFDNLTRRDPTSEAFLRPVEPPLP